MRQKVVMGNWKMNGDSASIAQLVEGLQGAELGDVTCAVFPSHVYLPWVQHLLQDAGVIGVGAQDVSEHQQGAYTGEVSAAMVRDLGCLYCLVGHSERRQYHRESDKQVAAKFIAAQQANLIPVLCVGETDAQRQKGDTEKVIKSQLQAVLKLVSPEQWGAAIIAYEPVWAIGTGNTATPEQAQQVHAFIRSELAKWSEEQAEAIRIVYGGSVKPGNASELFALPDVDGGLVGGASLQAKDFIAICQA